MEYLDNSRRQWQQMEMREEVIQSQHQQCITMDLLGMHSFAGSNTIAPQSSSAALQANKTRKEQMFEKAVTPSDVGKLNRLVIPKQHAEKYFPLDTQAQEKGLLLSFEESTGSGKSWKFRYSYWNSSQSYVLTKGWSRFVKEKNLHAGDIVCFEREYAGESSHKLFISWRRRPKLHTPLDVRKRLNLPPFFNQTSNLFYHHQHQQQFPLPLLRSSPFNFDNNNNPNLCHATSYHPRWISPETKDILPSNPLRGFPISDFHLLSATATNASSSDVTSVVNNTEINQSVDMLSPHHGSLSKKGVRLFGVDLACSDGQKDGSKNVHVKSSIQEHLAPCKYQVLQSSPTSPHMQHQL